MSQTLSASMLLAVPLAPLAGSVLAGIWGTAFGGNKIGRGGSHTLTIAGVLIAVHVLVPGAGLKLALVVGAVADMLLGTWLLRYSQAASRRIHALAALVAAGGSVAVAAELVGVRPAR